MIKRLAATAVAAALLALPVFAQEVETYTEDQVAAATAAIEEAELSDESYRDFWCGAAFVIITQMLEGQGNADGAAQTQALADVLYSRVATEMIAAEVSEEDFTAMAQNFRILAISQTGPDGEADYTQDECVAAAQ